MAELKGFTFTVQAQGNFVIHAKNVEEAKSWLKQTSQSMALLVE